MSRPRSIYVIAMWSFLHFHYNLWFNLIKTDTLDVILHIFLEYALVLLDGNVDEESKATNFQTAKAQPQGVA